MVLQDTYELSNGVKIPKVGFGTWQIPDGDIAYTAVKTALELGYRHIDTAKVYGNESSVGRAIADSGLSRSEIFLTTKCPAETKTYDGALADFDSSLERLGTDHVDLYLIHAPWPWANSGQDCAAGNREVWRAFEEIYRSGRARAIGISNFSVADMKSLFQTAEILPMVNQLQYYVGFAQPKNVAFSRDHGLLVEAYSPLATGAILDNPSLREIASKYDVSPAQLAIRFCLDSGTLPLPKATTRDHIAANAQLDFQISPADMSTLNALRETASAGAHHPFGAE